MFSAAILRIVCRSTHYALVRVLFQMPFVRRIVLLCVWCVSVLRLHVGVFLGFHSLSNDFNKLDTFSGCSILDCLIFISFEFFCFRLNNIGVFHWPVSFFEIPIKSDWTLGFKYTLFILVILCVCVHDWYTHISRFVVIAPKCIELKVNKSCEMDLVQTHSYRTTWVKYSVESWKFRWFYRLDASNRITHQKGVEYFDIHYVVIHHTSQNIKILNCVCVCKYVCDCTLINGNGDNENVRLPTLKQLLQ